MAFEVLDKINEMLSISPNFILSMLWFLLKYEKTKEGIVESVKYIKQERKPSNAGGIRKMAEEFKRTKKTPDYIEIEILCDNKRYSIKIKEEHNIAAGYGLILEIREKSCSGSSPDKILNVTLLMELTEKLDVLPIPLFIEVPEGSAVIFYITEKSARLCLNLGYYLILPCFFNLYMSSLCPKNSMFTKFPQLAYRTINHNFNIFLKFLESIQIDAMKDVLSYMVQCLITTLEESEKYSYKKYIKKLKKYL